MRLMQLSSFSPILRISYPSLLSCTLQRFFRAANAALPVCTVSWKLHCTVCTEISVDLYFNEIISALDLYLQELL